MDNTVENGWTSAYNPAEYEKSSEISEVNNVEPTVKKKREGKPLLITLQLIISLIVFLSFYALRLFLPDTFNEIHSWYEKNLNNEIILSESFEDFSLDNLLDAVKNK